jgi:peptide/nickel transport system substrate-binding protein
MGTTVSRALRIPTILATLVLVASVAGFPAGGNTTHSALVSSISSEANGATTPTLKGTTCGTPLRSTNPIIVDQAQIPDSLDPAVSFSTPGWGAIQQTYQGLVNYNGSSATRFEGVLANNWTESPNGLHWNFTLRSGVHFSNGDPFDVYVMWFSLYRSLLLEQGPQFILEQNFYSTNFNSTSPLTYYSKLAAIRAANSTLVSDLNHWNFFAPTSAEVAKMETSGQSFEVINASTLELNVGNGYLGAVPYTYLLATLSEPIAYAVDPAVVQANAGVVEGSPNAFLATHMIGTGQYLLSSFNGVAGGGYSLAPDPNYWGRTAAKEQPGNSLLAPANTSVELRFQSSPSVEISDLETGSVASASFALVDPTLISDLKRNPCVVAQALPTDYGATSGSWWVYQDQDRFPFDNLSVREAIAHAINYQQIITDAFGGYANPWVGPVPASYPYYDPGRLPPYSFNLTLAKQEMANSPCANNACLGLTFNYEYLSTGTEWADAATFVQADLARVGLTIHPVGISLAQLYVEQTVDPSTGVCFSDEPLNGGPFYLGQEFYASDYFSPDDWTQNDALSYGSANMCMSHYANATVDGLALSAAATSSPMKLRADYATITQAMYENYTDIWLVVPKAFAFYSPFLNGVIQNPMASAEPSAMLFNTQWAKNPVVVSRSYPGTYVVNSLVSEGSTALLDVLLPNLSNELVLFNAATNSSRVIQSEVPGGIQTVLVSAVSAGHSFFLAWENLTTGAEFWQKVSLAGKISQPKLPIGTTLLWSFPYGNSTSLYASYGRALVEISTTSLKLVANYTTEIPSNVSLASVLPVGHRLYLGGSWSLPNFASNAYFGYLNLTSKKVTTISKILTHYPANLTGDFVDLLARGTTIYVGGYLESVPLSPYSIQTVGGYLYEFLPSPATFKNLSSLLPVKSWGVYALEPWATTVALSMSGYRANATSLTLAGGIYTLSSAGKSVANETPLFPNGYLAFIYGVTSASNGWYFSGGFNTIAGIGEVVAVRT